KLVTGSDDKTLRIWERKMGVVEVLHGHTDTVQDVDVSRNGKMIVSGSHDRTIRIWNAESGETLHVFEGHKDWVASVQFSPDSSKVVSGSLDKTVRVWSIETGELAFEPINVQIWNAETGNEILSIRNSSVNSVAWTADGTHIIGGRSDGVTIWDSHNGEQLRTWKADNRWNSNVALSPTRTHVVTCKVGDKTAFVFDISTGERVATFKHDATVCGIAYSPSGHFIATGCNDGKLCLW
ncbi:hypothetical protein PAXINDRAFT_48057, partial [Paxillus involutus ATCC 200175]